MSSFSCSGVGDIVVLGAEDGIGVLKETRSNFDVKIVCRATSNDKLDVCGFSDSTFPLEGSALRSSCIAFSVLKAGFGNKICRIVEPDEHLSVLAKNATSITPSQAHIGFEFHGLASWEACRVDQLFGVWANVQY